MDTKWSKHYFFFSIPCHLKIRIVRDSLSGFQDPQLGKTVLWVQTQVFKACFATISLLFAFCKSFHVKMLSDHVYLAHDVFFA